MPGPGAAVPQRTLDELDRGVIALLQSDGRMSYARIGREVGLSEGAVRQRVQRLLADGAIDVVAVPRAARDADAVVALVGIRGSGQAGAVARAIAALDESSFVVATAGAFDVVAELRCRDHAHLLQVVDEDVRGVPGVAHVETMMCLAVHKMR